MQEREETAIRALIHEAMAALRDEDLCDGVPPDIRELSGETPIADLGMDSVASLELVGFVEEKLGASFPDDRLSSVETLGDLIRLIAENSP